MYKPANVGAATTTPMCDPFCDSLLSQYQSLHWPCRLFFINLQYTIWHAADLILYYHSSVYSASSTFIMDFNKSPPLSR